MADAALARIELREEHTEQHGRHAEPHSSEERRHHLRKHHVTEHLRVGRSHRARAGHEQRREILHRGDDGHDHREHAVG